MPKREHSTFNLKNAPRREASSAEVLKALVFVAF
jgi:hypothetical protein